MKFTAESYVVIQDTADQLVTFISQPFSLGKVAAGPSEQYYPFSYGMYIRCLGGAREAGLLRLIEKVQMLLNLSLYILPSSG